MTEEERLRRENARLRDERLKLDRRLHNQRIALRENWEIVEMRRKWLGSDTARKLYCNLLKKYRTLKADYEQLEHMAKIGKETIEKQ